MTALILIAAAAGVAVALQGQFMGSMNRTVGTATAAFITYGVGGVIATLVWLFRRAPLGGIRQVPSYAWSSGALGLVIVGAMSYAAPRLGLSRTIVITVAAQLLGAVIIDHFGLFTAQQRSFDAMRVLGLALTVAGAWLIVKE